MKKVKKFLLNTWEVIQNTIGKMEVKKHHLIPSHKFKGCSIYYITHNDSHCLGKYVFINKYSDEHIILRHEYGHRILSMILGPLYMMVDYIPSFLHYMYFSGRMLILSVSMKETKWDEYYNFYTEKWASYLSKKKTYNN